MLILLVLTHWGLFADGKCPSKAICSKKESQSDHVLQGHVLREFRTDRFPSCFSECRRDKRCMSVNFNLATLVCQVNHQTAESRPSWFIKRKHFIYAEHIDRYPGTLFSLHSDYNHANYNLSTYVNLHNKICNYFVSLLPKANVTYRYLPRETLL